MRTRVEQDHGENQMTPAKNRLGGPMLRMLSAGLVILAIVLAGQVTEAQMFGSWVVDAKGSSTVLYAAALNDSGRIFGQFCYPGEGACVWLIGLRTSCVKGNRYPVLANSDAGAVHLEVLCGAQLDSGLYRYAFTNFDQVDNLVRQGGRVGFAVPLQQDEFVVVRFDLRGASEALAVMRRAAEDRTPSVRGTRDRRM